MSMFKTLLDIDLKLFDAGAAAGGGAGAAGDGAAVQAGSNGGPDSSRQGNTGGEPQRIVYGRQTGANGAPEQAPDAGETHTETASTPAERKARFRALIDGEFKDLYSAETQSMLDRRMRKEREKQDALRSSLDAQKPVIDAVMARYGIPDGDMAKLAAAIQADDAMWSGAAEEAGMNVEQFKRFQRLQMENAQLRQAQERREAEGRMRAQLAAWDQEAAGLKNTVEGFDLPTELQNETFKRLLMAQVPIETAYQVAHLDDIKAQTATQAAASREKAVVDNIKAKGQRPTEAGLSSQNGVIVKSDVSQLTDEDMDEIIRRVRAGERISF